MKPKESFKTETVSIILAAVRAVRGDTQEVVYFVGVENADFFGGPTIKDMISNDKWHILSEDDEWIERWRVVVKLPNNVCFRDNNIAHGIYKGSNRNPLYPLVLPVRCEMIEHDDVVQPDIASAIEKIAQSGIRLCMDNSSEKMIARVISKELIAKYPSSHK